MRFGAVSAGRRRADLAQRAARRSDERRVAMFCYVDDMYWAARRPAVQGVWWV